MDSMAEYRVTSAKLRESADAINSSSKDFRQVIEEIKGIMETVRSAWASEAAEQFHVQLQKLNANFDSYERVITQYSAYLTKTADEYANVDGRTLNDTQVLDGSSLFA